MKQKSLNDAEIEKRLRGMFEKNYHRLRLESGHALTPEIKEAALQQVLYYWKKLRDLANTITDTEVRLHLPNQLSKGERKFGIEGVVDIVREEGNTTMYDLKTHAPEYVRQNIGEYEEQLNVYAHIWKKLRGQELGHMAVITTQLPDLLIGAVRSNNLDAIKSAMDLWEPVIPIAYDPSHVEETVDKFGDVVDAIENHNFSPPQLRALKKVEIKGETFATRVCRNCDVRYSCDPFRILLREMGTRGRRGPAKFILESLTEEEVEDRFEESLKGEGALNT